MSMQELTDDQLDGLFRKSAEEFNPPRDPAAWQAMGQMLDAHNQSIPAPKPSVWKKNSVRGLLLLVLLMLSVGSWLAYRQLWAGNQSSIKNIAGIDRPTTPLVTAPLADRSLPAATPSPPGLVEKVNLKPTGSAHAQETVHPELVAKTVRPVALPVKGQPKQLTREEQPLDEDRAVSSANKLTGTTRVKKKLGPARRPVYVNRTSSSLVTPVNNEVTSRSSKINRNALKNRTLTNRRANLAPARLVPTSRRTTSFTSRYAIRQQPTFSNQPFTEQPKNNPVPQTLANVPDNVSQPVAVAELTTQAGQWPKRLLFTGRELILPDTGEVAFFRKPLVQSQPRQTGLSIRLVVAPDLSVIGLKDFQRPGTNVGMMLEYRLSTRWSVQTGVLQSTKVYKSNTLPAYTQKWTIQPESVSGQCKILDIPLNLRYDVAFRPDLSGQIRGRWFVSGGLTSYIMWKEDYSYNYADPTSPHIYDPMRGWHGRTGWNGFSQLNLSAGYERTLSRRLSWQVEPFLKIPLKGVGYYKIDLLSTGAFLSLRYKL